MIGFPRFGVLAGLLLAALGAHTAESPRPAPDFGGAFGATPVAENLGAALGPAWKGLPDWRGVWYIEEPLIFAGPAAAVIPKNMKSTAKPLRGVDFERGVLPGSYFTGAPYKPEYQKAYDERVAKARAGEIGDPIDNCYTPHGMPRLMGAGPTAVEFHLTPRQTWIVWDAMNQTRRILTDGRPHPADQEWPRVMGDSIGHWEKGTLVIDTVWMNAGIYDRTGAPHSDQVHIVERVARTDADTMTVEMIIEDPVMFTKPWQVTRHYKRSQRKQENIVGTYCDVGDTQAIRN
jgi:hypothetical protein